MVSFPVFFQLWADRMRWKVPSIHWVIVSWLNDFGQLGCLRVFRGAGKSTIIDIWMAWEVYRDNCLQTLLQSESDPMALKSSRDVQNILRNHPLTKGMFVDEGTIESWFTYAGRIADPRNPQFYAKGILSNVTGARAGLIVNDDVEVLKNVQTPEMREKLQFRLQEQIYIAIPGCRTLFVGTPHTVDTLYEEVASQGANCLTIPLFSQDWRLLDNPREQTEFWIGFEAVNVFSGIGKHSKMLHRWIDYDVNGGYITFFKPPAGLVDVYGRCAWPERFDHKELELRRRRTKTIGYWDSQYMLRAAVIHDSRLNPVNANEYDCELQFRSANGEVLCYLGNVHIIGSVAYWDCAEGRKKSDASTLSLIAEDARGCKYWHAAEQLNDEGQDYAIFNDNGQITGGQVMRIRELVIQYKIPCVVVETTGTGSFCGTLLKQALRGTGCAVVEFKPTVNKQVRILEAFEGPLSTGTLWMHTRVCDSPAWAQLRDFNPLVTKDADDFIDSGAGAIKAKPVRIGAHHRAVNREIEQWRNQTGIGGTYDIKTDWG